MMYQLYFSPGACSLAVNVVLRELGQEFELINASISEGKTRTPEYLKLNPRGQVPLLMIDGTPIREGAAQIVYLCDTHTNDLLPKSGLPRATALQWLMFGNATLHPAYSAWFGFKRASNQPELLKAAADKIQTLWDQLETELAGKPYICGANYTPADALFTVISGWGGDVFTYGPNCQALFEKVRNRPAFQAALAAEGLPTKAAA